MTRPVTLDVRHQGLDLVLSARESPRKAGALMSLVLSVKDFGAAGDGMKDDSAAIQAALDAATTTDQPRVVWFERTTYRTTRTLFIKQHGVRIEGNDATIKYVGDDYALDVVPLRDVYPQSFSLHELNIELDAAARGAKGVRWRFSRSFARGVSVRLRAHEQIGFEILGDKNGTGPYYNTFIDCSVQGQALPKGSNQRGWVFTYDPGTPTRGPNANVFIRGRTGQVDVAWSLLAGAKNLLLGVTCEGIAKTVFEIGHPTSAVGCVSNTIQDVYVEGAAGADVFQIGKNSIDTAILNPFVTSIGTGKTYVDEGVATRIYAAAVHKLPTKGFVLMQPSSADPPVIQGPYPGLCLRDPVNGTNLTLRNSSSHSEATSFFTVRDGEYDLLLAGKTHAQLSAHTLLLNNSKLGIYSGTGVPTFAADKGSLYLRRDENPGPRLYVYEGDKWSAK